jgi:hypothetical protein
MLQSRFKRALVLVLTLFCGLLESSPSRACSCEPEGSVVQVVPEDGAFDVPVNVVPWVRARGTVRLLDPDGNVVEVVEQSHTPRATLCIFTRELRPVAPLLPNTTYRVQVDPFLAEDSDNDLPESSFTTGDTPLASTEWGAIELNSRVFDATSYLSSCVYEKYQACVDAGLTDDLLDVRVFAGEEQAIHYVDFANNLYNIELPHDATCLEVRARDFAGETSPPARRCFDLDQAPVLTLSAKFTIFPDCQAADFDDHLVPREDGTHPDEAGTSSTADAQAINPNEHIDAGEQRDAGEGFAVTPSDAAVSTPDTGTTSMEEDLDAHVPDARPQNSNEGGAQDNDPAVAKPIESGQTQGCSLARHAESRSCTPGVAAILVALGFVFAFRRGGRAN